MAHTLLQKRRLLAGFGLGQLAEEIPTLLRPPPSDFATQHDKASPTVLTCQLGVPTLFPAPSCQQSSTIKVCALRVWHPIPPEWRHHRRVDGQLCSVEQRESAVVGSVWNHNVQVSEECVDRDTTASLSANTCRSRLQGEPPTAQHSHWVAKAVEETATPAGTLSGRQGEGEASKQEHTEHLWLETSVWRRGATRKRESCERTTLRPDEGPGSRKETWPHSGTHEEIVGRLGGLLLPTMMPRTNIFEIRESLRAQPVGQCIPLRRIPMSCSRSLATSAPLK